MKLRELLQQLTTIQNEIRASEPFICGGTPRDRYLKRLDNISDVDITTGDKTINALSVQFEQELSKKYNITRRVMGDGHSTINIGTFKMDFSSNYNVPNIEMILQKQGLFKPTELQKEMFSRDFTCNALLLSLDLKNLIDPTHRGFKDIQNRIITTCLSPEITLTTNRNRVARSIYLACKLDFNIDPKIIKFVSENPQSVKIATERSLSEKLNDAFNRDPDKASSLVSQMNLWGHIPITKVIYPYYIKVKGANVK